MSHFNVTILKSGPSPFNLPRFQSRPALILLISTSGLIRMETVFHPEIGPVLHPHWGWERERERETKWWGGMEALCWSETSVKLIGFCVTQWRGGWRRMLFWPIFSPLWGLPEMSLFSSWTVLYIVPDLMFNQEYFEETQLKGIARHV